MRRTLSSEVPAVFGSWCARMRRSQASAGASSSALAFVASCLIVSVVFMIYTNEEHVRKYFRRAELAPSVSDSSRYTLIPRDSDSDDLDPDLEEDVPAAYRAFVFAPQAVESDDMDWWQRQASRKEHIKRTCERVLGNFEGKSASNNSEPVSMATAPMPERLLKDMSLDPDDSIMFCPSMLDLTQKATRWDTLLAHAGSEALRVVMTDGIRGISDVDLRSKPKPASSATQVREAKPQDMSWLKRFTKILFVQHPFEKVVSLYRHRLEDRLGYLGQEMGKRTLLYTRGARNVTERDLESGSPSFREMTSFIVHRDFLDPHVKSVYEVCGPCEFDYDYIIKTETFAEDLKHIFKQIYPAPKWRKMLDKFPSFRELDDDRIEKTLLKYYKDVSEEDLLMLYDLYSIDMFMFNYQWPFDKLRLKRIHDDK